jgi:hypothetical protein
MTMARELSGGKYENIRPDSDKSTQQHFIPHMMQAITSVVDTISLNNNTNFKSYKILQPNMKHLLNLAKYYYLYFHAIKRSIQLINFPIQKLLYYCHAGAKGERSYSSYSFLTSALNWVSGQCCTLAMLYPGKGRLVLTG